MESDLNEAAAPADASSYKHTVKMLRKAIHKRDYLDTARICLIIANGSVFHSTGIQILSETFQTESSMRRALKRAASF